MVFDMVTINRGWFYFPNAGLFVCPDDSLYMFAWSIMIHDEDFDRVAEVRLMLSGEVVKSGPRSSKSFIRDSGSSSTQTILQCEEMKAVYLEVVISDPNPQHFYSRYKTFMVNRLQNI